MQIVTPEIIKNKKVLLRLDIDVPIENGQVVEDFRLRSGMETLCLCLDYAETVIVMGHIGRPGGKKVDELSVEPVYDWLQEYLSCVDLDGCKLRLLENLRFEAGEEAADLGYAQEIASLGNFYINEAFASHHPAASTTILPTLLPHAAGLNFAKEVEMLNKVRENPDKPLVTIIGGVKIEDKLSVVEAMANISEHVLVGGKIASQIPEDLIQKHPNILAAKLNEEGTDITEDTVQKWKEIILKAKMIVWNGPLGYVEDPKNIQSKNIAQIVIKSGAETILGGGDTISAINKWGLLNRFIHPEPGRRAFVSTGGGAMLKFLVEGTLPVIEALK